MRLQISLSKNKGKIACQGPEPSISNKTKQKELA